MPLSPFALRSPCKNPLIRLASFREVVFGHELDVDEKFDSRHFHAMFQETLGSKLEMGRDLKIGWFPPIKPTRKGAPSKKTDVGVTRTRVGYLATSYPSSNRRQLSGYLEDQFYLIR